MSSSAGLLLVNPSPLKDFSPTPSYQLDNDDDYEDIEEDIEICRQIRRQTRKKLSTNRKKDMTSSMNPVSGEHSPQHAPKGKRIINHIFQTFQPISFRYFLSNNFGYFVQYKNSRSAFTATYVIQSWLLPCKYTQDINIIHS